MSRRLDARIWAGDGGAFVYPEARADRPLTGVCFSGGGTRSYAATVGQLRGLAAAGLLTRVGYVSAVSGGAWAATAHAFYDGPGRGDDDILGAIRPPAALVPPVLASLSPAELGMAATRDFRTTLAALHAAPEVPTDQVWVRAVGDTFLSPFGLFDPAEPRGFTLDEASEQDLRRRNPDLGPMHRVRGGAAAPYLTIQATLNWPSIGEQATSKVGFELTPLYCGSPPSRRLREGAREIEVGGGVVESVAFGGRPAGPVRDGVVPIEQDAPFTLAAAVGASSAFTMPGMDRRFYPHVECWPVPPLASSPGRHVFTDGGDLDNYGILPLLRRGAGALIVFINTVWPLSLDLDPDAGWPVDPDPTARPLDPFLAPLFGAPSRRFPVNRVFPEADFPDVLRGLQLAKRAGGTVMTTSRHVVQENDWWGIAGGQSVRVCWVYNERVPVWEAALPRETRDALARGAAGPAAHFPHYRTQGQNPGALIRLSATQVNLLAHLGAWTVTANAAPLKAVLTEVVVPGGPGL